MLLSELPLIPLPLVAELSVPLVLPLIELVPELLELGLLIEESEEEPVVLPVPVVEPDCCVELAEGVDEVELEDWSVVLLPDCATDNPAPSSTTEAV